VCNNSKIVVPPKFFSVFLSSAISTHRAKKNLENIFHIDLLANLVID
jgi:hypothetical protein